MARDRRRTDELATRDDETQTGGHLAQDAQEPSLTFQPVDERDPRSRWIALGAAVLVALISFFVVGRYASDPAFYAKTVAALDEKRETVMKLVGASTGSSAAVSLLPGDAGTPIAEKLVDLSSDFLIVIAAIYLEKYLLTILGFTAFKVLIPVACLLFSIAVMLREGATVRQVLSQLAVKLLLFGLAAALVVPVSVKVSGMIEDTYEASINQTLQTAEQTTDAIEDSADEGKSTDATNPLSFLLNVPEELNKLTEGAQNALNNFIEALAVMIVTSCVIPILVLLFFLWLMRTILGVDVDIPMGMRSRRRGSALAHRRRR